MHARKWIGLAAAIGFLALPSLAQAQRIVYIVRHAERADGGAGTGQMQGQKDPPLSAAGEARAVKLAAMLADAGVKAIFSTQLRRTQDTVRPLVARIKGSVQPYEASSPEALVAKLQKDHADDVVLVVGHSNTVPPLIKALGGGDITIRDDEYDNLFVFIPATKTLSRIKF